MQTYFRMSLKSLMNKDTCLKVRCLRVHVETATSKHLIRHKCFRMMAYDVCRSTESNEWLYISIIKI